MHNPLKGFKTKDLLITFVAILLFFFSGFGVGWFSSSCNEKPLTAYASSNNVSSVILNDNLTMVASSGQDIFVYAPFCYRTVGDFHFVGSASGDTEDYSGSYFVYYNPTSDYLITIGITGYSYTQVVNPSLDFSVYSDVSSASSSAGSCVIPLFSTNLPLFTDINLGSFTGSGIRCLSSAYSLGVGSSVATIDFERIFSGFGADSDYFNVNLYFLGDDGTTVSVINYEYEFMFPIDYEPFYCPASLSHDLILSRHIYQLGYDKGYNLGLSASLKDISPFRVLSSGVTDFLQIEILPNVKISLLLSVGFGLIILGFLLKFFLGG